jgi:F-type H+-transporting ATPase subunit b
MQVDWLTVAAQITNFLVLVWLLQRFLYGPITRAMKRREQRIAERLREADANREEAEKEADEYRAKRQDLEERREQIMAQAREDADEERKALEQDARHAAEQSKQEWLQQMEDQRAEFLRHVRLRSTEHFYALARRALADLADIRLEEQIGSVFIEKLSALDAETKRKIAAEARKAGNAVTVRSRFEMSANLKRQVTKAIHDGIHGDAEVSYEQSPAAAVGMELRAGGQTVSWNLDSYLDGLESRVASEFGGGRPYSG